MSEKIPESVVQDPLKAEIMAHATNDGESAIVNDRNEIISLLARASEFENALPTAERRCEELKESRQKTDEIATKVGELYDEVHKY